jgi:hypothetical protein
MAREISPGRTAVEHLPCVCISLAGKGKLLNIERTRELFGSLGIPLPVLNAYLAGATECFGGLLLVAGSARASWRCPAESEALTSNLQ